MTDTTNLPTVAPVEGWYGMTRGGRVIGPFILADDGFCWFGDEYLHYSSGHDGRGQDEYSDVYYPVLDIISVQPPAAVFALFGLVGNDAPPPQEPPA